MGLCKTLMKPEHQEYEVEMTGGVVVHSGVNCFHWASLSAEPLG